MKKQEKENFFVKFNELNEKNQKYILAIQQALTFAQSQNQHTNETPPTNKSG